MKRILFTDDEPRILDGLRRMLRGQRREWEMVFALEGRAAVADEGTLEAEFALKLHDGVGVTVGAEHHVHIAARQRLERRTHLGQRSRMREEAPRIRDDHYAGRGGRRLRDEERSGCRHRGSNHSQSPAPTLWTAPGRWYRVNPVFSRDGKIQD